MGRAKYINDLVYVVFFVVTLSSSFSFCLFVDFYEVVIVVRGCIIIIIIMLSIMFCFVY
jgi:hypothetical protein